MPPQSDHSRTLAPIYLSGRKSKRDYIIREDNYNKNLRIAKLEKYQFTTRVHKLKATFARHGIPKRIISDDETQSSSKEFPHFAKTWVLNTSRSVHITTEPSPLQGVSGENLKEWNSKTHWLTVRLMIKASASDYLEQGMHCGQLPIPFPSYYSLSISPQHYCLCMECEGLWHWVYPSHKYCKME